MLRRESEKGDLHTEGFLISVEMENSPSLVAHVMSKFVDSIKWVEGIGDVDVTPMGIVDSYKEKNE